MREESDSFLSEKICSRMNKCFETCCGFEPALIVFRYVPCCVQVFNFVFLTCFGRKGHKDMLHGMLLGVRVLPQGGLNLFYLTEASCIT